MPVTNRLHLDFSLETIDERNDFVSTYIQSPQFIKNPLTSSEVDTIANYILWGKDASGKNLVQQKEIELDSRYSTWSKEEPESLDAIIESSSYDDILLQHPTEARPKIPRVVFSRSQTLRECPADMRDTFTSLFDQIDRLDLGINIYEWSHGRRKNPPREKLVEKFSQDEYAKIEEETHHWNQHIYLKKRHQEEVKQKERYFDFRELEHVYHLFNAIYDLEDYSERATFYANTSKLLDTMNYYLREAKLSDIHRDILQMKVNKQRNQDIAYDINHKYGKTYTANYISTIFRHKIIPKVNEAAIYHEKIVENLPFREEFKVCSKCGRMLLKDTKYFGRKSRSKDGYCAKCKDCDKEERSSKK